MTNSHKSANEKAAKLQGMENVIRIGLIVLLFVMSFLVMRPFIVLLLWALVIAVVAYPAYTRLESLLKPHRILAALLFTLLMLVILIVPIALLGETLVSGTEKLVVGLEKGSIQIPPPPEAIASWPVIGERLETIWHKASQESASIPAMLLPHLKAASAWLLSTIAGMGMGFLQLILAILIAGVMLARRDQDHPRVQTIITRVAGEKGSAIFALVKDTIRSVSQGILGVAVIQALLAGIGFLVVGVPAAGLWALCCLVLCIIQIGLFPVTLPMVVYVFYSSDLIIAVPFLIWSIFISLLDNVLKPMFFSHGVDAPFLVIFIGAIGGLMAFGLLGLFVGAVVLVVAYKLFVEWLHEYSEPPVES